jgi:hypothetical protein
LHQALWRIYQSLSLHPSHFQLGSRMHHGCMKQRIWVRPYPCQRPGVGAGVVGYCRKQAGRRASAECLVALATAAEVPHTPTTIPSATTQQPPPPTHLQQQPSQRLSSVYHPHPAVSSVTSNITAASTTDSWQPASAQPSTQQPAAPTSLTSNIPSNITIA